MNYRYTTPYCQLDSMFADTYFEASHSNKRCIMSSEIPYMLGVCPVCVTAQATLFVGFPNRNGRNVVPLPEKDAYVLGEHQNQYARQCTGSGATPERLLSGKKAHAAA